MRKLNNTFIVIDFCYIIQLIFCSLGALHDGYDNGCDIAGDYIMSASLGLTNNITRGQPWFFSSCSVDEIDAFITVLNR